MTEASQSVEEIVTYTRRKWEYLATDSPVSERSKESSDKAETRDDPIYAGGFKAYRSDKGKNVEPYWQTLRRMSKQGQRFKTWNAQQLSGIQKQLPPEQSAYNFEREIGNPAPQTQNYSGSFENIARQYLMTEGKEFYAFQKAKGREFYDITRIESADLESIADGAIAALENDGKDAALLGSYNFDEKAQQFADHYGVSKDRAITYLLTHELAHASAKGIGFDDHIQSELYVENTLNEYFTAKGDYDLAVIAGDRAANVTENYSGSSSLSGASDYGSIGASEN